ncbi:MAG TPA: nucleotidyltransferase family protein, partial [Gemmatimonadaceae bacterium]|nr:nucleotidyltransferase family protein [Gemmatimonadaceae bacterium]
MDDELAALGRFSSEMELMLRSLRARPPGGAGVLATMPTMPIDWPTLLAVAQRNGVLAPLHGGLAGEAGVPQDVTRRLEKHVEANAARNRHLLAELSSLLDVLERRGVDVIPFRSSAVASPLAEIVDLDLLVRRRDVGAAARVLLELRFEPEVPLGTAEAASVLRTGFARKFVGPQRVVVSLQWAVAPAAERMGSRLERLLAMRTTVSMGERTVSSLAPPAMLHLLCLRGTLNRWHRLTWVRDVAGLLARMTAEEEELAWAQARATGSARAVGLG